MNNGRLETCKTALLSGILPTCLHADDHVGLIVFDDTINVRVDMAPWAGEHKTRLTDQLRHVQTRNTTNLWMAMSAAIVMFADSDRTKWIVALTDGMSHDGPSSVQKQLRTSFGLGIRVLFITIDLHSEHENPIRDTCMRDIGDEMISANGGLAAIQKAWQTVGDRLTVSEKIMKQGETVTPAECCQLLRGHMKLDSSHQHWSRLKQKHWIRYLFRRCEILAASEKFNKNKDFSNFGSTTMKIMLDEVSVHMR